MSDRPAEKMPEEMSPLRHLVSFRRVLREDSRRIRTLYRPTHLATNLDSLALSRHMGRHARRRLQRRACLVEPQQLGHGDGDAYDPAASFQNVAGAAHEILQKISRKRAYV